MEKQSFVLCDREKEIDEIKKVLDRHSFLDEQPYVCFVHGPSGVGKSTLCEYLREKILPLYNSTYFYLISLDVTETSKEYEVVRQLYKVMKEKGISFLRYEIACNYLSRIKSMLYKIDAPMEKVNSIIDQILEIPKSLLGEEPVTTIVGESFIKVCGELLKEIVSAAQEELYRKKMKSLTEFCVNLKKIPANTIVNNLTEYWVEDLNEAISDLNEGIAADSDMKWYLVFMLDAYEKRPINEISNYDWFQSKLIANLKNVVWYIFSTEVNIECDWRKLMFKDIELRLFEDDEKLDDYLRDCGVEDEQARKYIIEQSEGLPAAVQILLDIYRVDGKFDTEVEYRGYQQLFEQYFKKHITAEEQKILLKLAVFPCWNYTVFQTIFSENSNEKSKSVFDSISNNAALVSILSENEQLSVLEIDLDNTQGPFFKLTDIVRKTILKLLENNIDRQADMYKSKFAYYKEKVDNIIGLMKEKKDIVYSYKTYDRLSRLTKIAFETVSYVYLDKMEFEEISKWCLSVEQIMTRLGFFELKAELCKMYLERIRKRDNFRFDSNDDENKRFAFQFTRDLIWSYHELRDADAALKIAGDYLLALLKQYGVNYYRIPFAFYLLGLVFQDMKKWDTAIWFLNESIEFAAKLGENDTHPDAAASTQVTAKNALAYIYMERNELDNAETFLLGAQEARANSDKLGKWTGYNNFVRFYLQRIQECGSKSVYDSKINEYYNEAEKYYLESEELIDNEGMKLSFNNEMKRKTRKIVLDIVKSIKESSEGVINIEEMNDYIEKLEGMLMKIEINSKEVYQRDFVYIVFSIYHNLGVLYALTGDYDKALKKSEISLSKKENYYKMEDSVYKQDYEKATIKNSKKNIEVIQKCLENRNNNLNAYDLVLQYP